LFSVTKILFLKRYKEKGWIRGIQGIEGIPLEVPYAKKCKQKNINQ
jgi:hypothetical protein